MRALIKVGVYNAHTQELLETYETSKTKLSAHHADMTSLQQFVIKCAMHYILKNQLGAISIN